MSARAHHCGHGTMIAIAITALCPLTHQAAEPLAGFQRVGERWTYRDESLSMQGILLRPEGAGPFPAVLISHGLGGSAQSFGLNKAREMVKWGLVCIACDYTHAATAGRRPDMQGPGRQNFGASEENLKRASKCLEILASLPEVDSKKLCAYGHSMGGFVTIGLAAKEPDRLRAAAISGSGVAPRDGFPAPSADAAKSIKTPFIMFHGEIDNTVRPEQSQSLKDILERNGVANERHVFVGINHPVDQQKAPEVYGLMRKWFAKFELVTPDPAVSAPQPSSSTKPSATSESPEWIREKVEARHVHYRTFRSAAIGQDVSYLIYVPPQYESSPDARFPVMYWLHGIGGAQTGIPPFVERFNAAIEAGQAPAMLIVFVNGVRNSFYCDSADGKVPVETVIVKDLLPHIDSAYRTIARREARIVEGFSMGGFGAAHLGFKHPELFGAVSIIDGALVDLRTMQTRHADLYQRIFGGNEARFDAENPRTLVETNADALRGRTAVRLAVGALVGGNRSFHEQLTTLKIEHSYDEFDVGHNHGAIYDRLGDRNWKFYREALAGVSK